MSKIPDNPLEYFAALPAFKKELEGKYAEILEKLRDIAPDLVERHEALITLEFSNEEGLDDLVEMIGDPTQEPE